MQLTERTDGDNGIHHQQRRRSILGYVEVVFKKFQKGPRRQIGQNNLFINAVTMD